MSTEPVLSRKERQAQRDAERRGKGKKRKRNEVDDEDAQQQPTPPGDEVEDEGSKLTGADTKATAVEGAGEDANGVSTPKPKKRKKTKNTTTTTNDEDAKTTTKDDPTNKTRFILFIGNLPYTTTDTSLHSHFKKLEPFTLRHRTDPKTNKSKGFAFLEFENYDRMKTCLKLYHHSMFDPAKAGAKKDVDGEGEGEVGAKVMGKKAKDKGARRINVELTAGGGGKTAGRQEKIKAKNVRLDEQRKRRAELERVERDKEKVKGGGGGKNATAERMEVEDAAIHPSRLARIER